MLAVSVFQSQDVVVISGDAFDNQVGVQEVNDQIRVGVTGEGGFSFDANTVSSLRFIGRNGDDILNNQTDLTTIASGGNGNDRLVSGNGNDRLLGNAGNDTLISSGGVNLLNGASGDDIITGGIGNDTIYTADGDDTINAGAGNDYIVAGNDNDTVRAGDGDDTVFASNGDDTVYGDAGNDALYTQDGIDDAFGGDGDDLLRGGTGNDTLEGGDGDDRLLGEDGNDSVHGDSGIDVIFGGDNNDILFGGDDNDFLFGGLGIDTINGNNGNDQIRGNEGNDNLFGNAGNDRVAGDDGDDFLDGGGGSDVVLGDAGKDEILGTSTDFIRGGSGDDLIGLSSANGDTVAFSGNYSNYKVTETGPVLYVRDTTGADGLDAITGADSIRFSDQVRTAAADVSQSVFVQPIVVSNNNGGDTAGFFGDAESELTIKRLIDEIYLQANVNIEWLPTKTYNNTFANNGNASPRPTSDLNTIVNNGDNAGVGSSDPIIIDAYFVEVVPGFEELGESFANGLAFVGANGTAIHIGDNLPGFAGGQDTAARVTAHELGHNFGLEHVHNSDNLLNVGSPGSEITRCTT